VLGVFLVCLDGAQSTTNDRPPNVLEIHDGNFEDYTNKGDSIVLFYAPWCRACQEFKPYWKELANALKQTRPQVGMYQVDCTLNPEAATKGNVQAYPTIAFMRNAKSISHFEGQRTTEELLNWVHRLAAATTPTPTAQQNARTKAADAQRQAQSAQQQQQHEQQLRHAQQQAQLRAQQQLVEQQQQTTQSTQSADQGQHAGTARPSSSESDKEFQAELALLKEMLEEWKFSWKHVVAIARQFLKLPMQLFADHPYLVLFAAWFCGILQGVFVGVSWAMRAAVGS